MSWFVLYVGLAFAGLVVLGACSVRVFVAVRGLGRELERTRARLLPRQETLKHELDRLERARE